MEKILNINHQISILKHKFIGHLRMPLYINAYYLMANTVIVSLLGFVFWTISARYYTPKDIGLASALISSMGLIMSISNLGLGTGLIRFLPDSKKPNSLINSSFTLISLASLLVGMVFLLGLNLWAKDLNFILSKFYYILFFLILAPAQALFSAQESVFIAYRSAKFTVIKNVTSALVRISLIILLTGLGTLGIFFAIGLSIIILALVGIFLLLPKVLADYKFYWALEKNALKNMIKFSFENYISALLGSLHIMILPLMILNILGAESNAYYYIAYSIAGILFVIPGAISTSLFAEGSNDISNLSHNIKRSLQLSLLLLSIGIIAVFLIGDKLLLLFGKTYSQASFGMLKLLSLSSIPLSINSIIFTILRVNFKMKTVINLSALNALGILLLAYILSQKFQLTSIGIAWIVMQSVTAGIAVLKVRR